ncbi:MAG: hypothetical protein HY921_04160 [Elusimicrobia bacterium]|nr:hypothetical protein [Elusimicrobiota bacterium]
MKKAVYFVAAFLALSLVGAAWAEGPEEARDLGKHKMFKEEFLKKLTDKLELSEDQQKKIKAVLDKSRPEVEKLHSEMKALGQKMKGMMAETRESIRQSLDPRQKEKFDELMVRMKERARGPKGRMPMGMGPRGRMPTQGEGGADEGQEPDEAPGE